MALTPPGSDEMVYGQTTNAGQIFNPPVYSIQESSQPTCSGKEIEFDVSEDGITKGHPGLATPVMWYEYRFEVLPAQIIYYDIKYTFYFMLFTTGDLGYQA